MTDRTRRQRPWLDAWMSWSELPMLLAATLAVGGYLAELGGVWHAWGVESTYHTAAFSLDLLFAADIVLKAALGGARYLWTPWFLIDLMCAAPLLGNLDQLASSTQSLRILRFMRVLRVLRVLRGLRSLRLLRLVTHGAETVEQRQFDRALTLASVAYAAAFLALVHTGRIVSALTPDTSEMYLVVGTMLGMGLVLVVARYQIPALWSRQVRTLLNVALPTQVAEWMLRHPEAVERSVRGPATVIFCDIRGFTNTAARLGIDDVKVHLERALDVIVEAHAQLDLIIDKFIGDAVLSFRGGDLVDGTAEDHAWRVVRAALDSEKALTALDDPYFREMKIGGASDEDALIGAFGTAKRLSYTVLGDRVNLAARLESACGAVGVRNLFCDRTRELLAGRSDLVWRRVGPLRVYGRDEDEPAWEVFDRADNVGWIDQYHAALHAFEERRFMEAASGFARLPHDAPSRRYGAQAVELQASGVPPDWSPALVLTKS